VRGKSIARGYWRNETETAATFGATLADSGEPFLRTGDLGFIDDQGEVYVVGRVKDLLIVRGLNYYPHDLEATAESAWSSLRPGCSAAFAIETSGREEIAIVCEYDAKAANAGVSLEAIADAVRSAIGIEHELAIDAIVIVAAGQVPKTSSGKVQRSETRRRFTAGELEVLHVAKAPATAQGVAQAVTLETAADIARFITSWLSEQLRREVSPDAIFSSLGIDSLESVRMIDTLGELLGEELNPMLAMDFPSANMLANRLATKRERG
jgi:acyl-CoA synthetase (AMP-forming)/AMP-acid ligase II